MTISRQKQSKNLVDNKTIAEPCAAPICVDDNHGSIGFFTSFPMREEVQEEASAFSVGKQYLHKHLSVVTLDENLQPPRFHKEYYGSSMRMDEKSLMFFSQNFPNLGIFVGKQSMNLFVVTATSMESFNKLGDPFQGKLKWISKCGDRYHAWFLCWDGVLPNLYDHDGLDILGHNEIVVLPGSKLPDGSYAKWILQEGYCPPIIDRSDLDNSLLRGIHINRRGTDETRNQIKKYNYTPSDMDKLTPIDKLLLLSDRLPFGEGKSGNNKRLLYMALIDRAIIEKPSNFRATARELELKIPVSRKSIVKYLGEFCAKGYIKEISSTELGKRYAFDLGRRFTSKIKRNSCKYSLCNIPIHDCWSSRGFGPTGKTILEKMLAATAEEHLNIVTIARLTGLSRVTVGKKLKQMKDLGLVTRAGQIWRVDEICLTPENLNNYAKQMGVNGNFNKRKERIDKERREQLIGNYLSGRG